MTLSKEQLEFLKRRIDDVIRWWETLGQHECPEFDPSFVKDLKRRIDKPHPKITQKQIKGLMNLWNGWDMNAWMRTLEIEGY